MPVKCQPDAEANGWKITLATVPVHNPPRGGVLRFRTKSVMGNTIEGDVFEFGGPFISTFTGTCRAVKPDRLNVMTFEFVWGMVHITVHGNTSTAPDGVNQFVGSFHATARTDTRESEGKVIATVPPEDGDIGTGNGTQT